MTAYSDLVTPWFGNESTPTRAGWYRVRKGPCPDDTFDCMGWFDGTLWCCFEQVPRIRVLARRHLVVFQWQGLVAPCQEVARSIVSGLDPKSARKLRFKPVADILRHAMKPDVLRYPMQKR